MDVQGHCATGFEPVKDAFIRNFDEGLEVGASVAVTMAGTSVVDLWAGDADTKGTPWVRDTLVNVYSTTKTMSAVCMLMLADRGLLDFDAPVAKYWPEFAQNGKEGVLVRHVMSHTSGLSGYDPPVTAAQLYDLDGIAAHLAKQTPWWEPGTRSGYHAMTQGNLEGEILYRITGKRLGAWFHDEVAVPLGADFYIGLPASEDGRVGELIPPTTLPVVTAEGVLIMGRVLPFDSIAVRTLTSSMSPVEITATREWRGAEMPAVNGQGNARSIARIHSMMANGGEVDGVRLISEAGALRGLEQQIDNEDQVLLARMRHGLGFALFFDGWVSSPNPRSMFWGGYGGSIAIVDFDAKVSIGYAMNRMDSELTGDVRGRRIVDAVYKCVG